MKCIVFCSHFNIHQLGRIEPPSGQVLAPGLICTYDWLMIETFEVNNTPLNIHHSNQRFAFHIKIIPKGMVTFSEPLVFFPTWHDVKVNLLLKVYTLEEFWFIRVKSLVICHSCKGVIFPRVHCINCALLPLEPTGNFRTNKLHMQYQPVAHRDNYFLPTDHGVELNCLALSKC